MKTVTKTTFLGAEMNTVIDVKLTSICSPICQALIYEGGLFQDARLNNCKELLVVRLDGTVIAYSTFDVSNENDILVKSLHFRSVIKDQSLGAYWLSRLLKRRLKERTYLNFLLDS